MAEARPIIFIHGLFHILQGFTAAGLGDRLVMTPDLPGYGSHEVGSSEISVASAAEYVHGRIRAANCGRAHIVGHSIGGAVGVLLVSEHPEDVASFINVEGNFTLKDAFWSAKIANMPAREVETLIGGYQDDPEGWLKGIGIVPNPERIALAGNGLNAQPAATIQAMARSVVEVTSESSYLDRVRKILERKIPFHLVAGEHSREGWDVPEFVLQQAASFTVQPGVGHLMMLEDAKGFLNIIQELTS